MLPDPPTMQFAMHTANHILHLPPFLLQSLDLPMAIIHAVSLVKLSLAWQLWELQLTVIFRLRARLHVLKTDYIISISSIYIP